MKRITTNIGMVGATAALAAGAVLAATFVRGSDGGVGEERCWPLDGDPAVSSNFCEYREGHFHAGLDIRTYGVEGVPCRAAGDGYVSRMRASPEGYGKTLYLRLETGETAVYAHLAEFDTTLERALYGAQRRAGSYTVDVRFPRGRFPVECGDVIAWSGSTGGIAPHLHFEIRDGGENPLNPFLNGFALKDRLSPRFERIGLVPLGPDGRINGRCWPTNLVPEQVAADIFTVADTLVLSGHVGLTAEVFDRLNGRSGRLAPHRVTLIVDDTTVADVRLERFSFAHTDQVDLLYDVGRVRREKAYFFQLFEVGGESMWNRTFTRGGLLGWKPAGGAEPAGDVVVHRAVVTASDASENAARLQFHFVNEDARALAREAWWGAPPSPDTVVPGYYFRGALVSALDPVPGIRGGNGPATPFDSAASRLLGGYSHPVVYTAGDLIDGPFPLPVGRGAGREYVYVIGIEEGVSTSVNFADLGLQLVFGKNTLYEDAVVYARAWNDEGRIPGTGELIPRSSPVQLGPYSHSLRADVEVRVKIDGSPDSTSALYRLNERKGEWVFYESAVDGEYVRTTVRRPGVYGAFDDPYGPRIRTPFVRARRSYASGERRPVVVVPMEDVGSGVNHRKTAVSIDGVEQIAYWDSRAKKLFVVVRDPNIMGRRSVSVVAYDNAGNRSELKTNVEIEITPRTRGED